MRTWRWAVHGPEGYPPSILQVVFSGAEMFATLQLASKVSHTCLTYTTALLLLLLTTHTEWLKRLDFNSLLISFIRHFSIVRSAKLTIAFIKCR